MTEDRMTNEQRNAKLLRCQGWQVAKERLISLLERIRLSLSLGKGYLSETELNRLERAHKSTIDAILRASKRIDRSSLSIKTFSNLPCPRCK
ncbi:MAG: hypothetical protein QXY94_05335, partial [Archaeoglobaceae archaeon]